MRAAYATSLSAFSGCHSQLSSTAPVTSASPAPRTGIANSSLAGTASYICLLDFPCSWIRVSMALTVSLNEPIIGKKIDNFYMIKKN